jgi:hypothetical protein
MLLHRVTLRSALQAGKLAGVLFQFHLTFGPSAEHRRHVQWCREHLARDIAMTVEFRSRSWFDTPSALQETQVCFDIEPSLPNQAVNLTRLYPHFRFLPDTTTPLVQHGQCDDRCIEGPRSCQPLHGQT